MHARDHAREVSAVRSGLVVTSLLCIVELVGGWLTNSVTLMSDAAHVLSDVGALGLSLFALWIASREASDSKTFGYYRAEILGALLNGVVLWVIVFFIGLVTWRRLWQPEPVAGGGMLVIATVGLAVNVGVAMQLRPHGAHCLNLRAAYLHVLADVFGSIGAVAAGLVIFATGWTTADPIASALIIVLVLVSSWSLVREAVDVLMEAVPSHVDLDRLRTALERVPGTDEVHDLHVWSLTSGRYALSAHAVICAEAHGNGDRILAAMADVCARDFAIDHVTIQIEHESRRAAEPTH